MINLLCRCHINKTLPAVFSIQRRFSSNKLPFDHYPLSIFEESAEHFPSSYGLIVLNYSKSSIEKWLTKNMWSQAKVRACADGGSNELRQFTLDKKEERLGRFTPDFISGDLDSITLETQQFYEHEFKVPLIETKYQGATDFTKCLQELQKKAGEEPLQHTFVFCTFAGRFDQAMSIIHTLYLHPMLQIFLISDQDVTFLLKPGLNRIWQIRSPWCGKYCSLIPFSSPFKVVTTGLQWNLNEKMELNFNTLISTSNTYNVPRSDFVTINTPQPLIWSMTLAKRDQQSSTDL